MSTEISLVNKQARGTIFVIAPNHFLFCRKTVRSDAARHFDAVVVFQRRRSKRRCRRRRRRFVDDPGVGLPLRFRAGRSGRDRQLQQIHGWNFCKVFAKKLFVFMAGCQLQKFILHFLSWIESFVVWLSHEFLHSKDTSVISWVSGLSNHYLLVPF